MTSSIRVTSLLLLVSVTSFSFLTPTQSRAQNNEAIAESLFHEGKKLYNEKRYAEACQRLDQSHRADPAGGTVLLLAMCYERLGRSSSAWAKYSEALALARRDGRSDREQKAQEAMAALEPQLTYVTVTLEPEAKSISNMAFELDGNHIPLLIDAKVPVDPGEHTLVVKATDYEPFTHQFSVTEQGATVNVRVPGLKPVEKAISPVTPAPTTTTATDNRTVTQPPQLEPKSNATRTVAYVLGGAGIVAAGVGGYFAWHAKRLDNDADQKCPDRQCDNSKAVEWSRDAVSEAKLASWLAGAGGAAIVTAGAMLIFGGNSSPNVAASAIVLPSGGALSLSGRY